MRSAGTLPSSTAVAAEKECKMIASMVAVDSGVSHNSRRSRDAHRGVLEGGYAGRAENNGTGTKAAPFFIGHVLLLWKRVLPSPSRLHVNAAILAGCFDVLPS